MEVTGIVLQAAPVSDYDKRIVILTKERGKITAFASGARKPNSKYAAATSPFSFGVFKVFEGRTAYKLVDADISNYFEFMREDFDAAMYGTYFLEVMDYYTRENNDEKDMLKLLYQSLRALNVKSLKKALVRYIFECKTLVVQGEFPGAPDDKQYNESTLYTLNYIAESPIERLYNFTVNEDVLKELAEICGIYHKKLIVHKFKSLDMIED